MQLFNRIASVTFGPSGTEDGIRVDGLRIQFTVSKTLTPTTNTCRVSIFNLSESTHNKIKTNETLILRAGYGDDGSTPPILALGIIKSVMRSTQDTDRISIVTLEDGLAELRHARMSVSYPDGTAASQVLDAAIAGLEVASYELPVIDEGIQYVSGLAFEGPARVLMSKVCSKLGLEWSIQTGQILVVPKGGTGMIAAVLLNAQSGLISTPEKQAEESDELKADEDKRPDGWQVRSLLRSEIVPGGALAVESTAVTGNYRIESVVHAGDTHGEEWTSTVILREPKEAA